MSHPFLLPRFAPRRSIAVVTVLAGSLLLAGCAAAVPLTPAADATNVACADVIVHLPSTVADERSRETNAQGTGAWGDPAAVLLHCGVPVPAPTTLPCLNINGIDWIEDDSDAPTYRYTTYGRDPAIEVVIDSEAVSGSTALVDVANAVGYVPAAGACVGAEDVRLPTDGATTAP
ncbi:Protein of unknown function [Cryobacterium flavum]|uniref:DUF3515 domain-containing protein n=1 Tax=Cryobacterium flavum TaxID=1424659 RepID=A0A4R8VFC2_9MICO|nr:DUF3515 family protein [Cryobacterium flavum]TFB82246.1 DUF3515 domain-containing protein [Cryobacterium flavum]SDN93677.1 Protein of unknown function [Cryobacterium flavum]